MFQLLKHRRKFFQFTQCYALSGDGTVTTSGDYKIHKFSSSGTFHVQESGNYTIIDNMVWYMVLAGGGAGGSLNSTTGGSATSGGGGSTAGGAGTSGTANTGGGAGGGAQDSYNGGSGGSGIVIIRYQFQAA